MKKTQEFLREIKLIGITARTNNALEMNLSTAKIPSIIQRYFQGNVSSKITHRKKPGTIYCVYTDYESDFTGNYTYFIGEEVETFDNIAADFKQLTIPPQTYVKFTTEPGAMPDVCIKAWQEIWQMTSEELGGKRNYIADFEIYDERAADLQKAVLDIYIGITI